MSIKRVVILYQKKSIPHEFYMNEFYMFLMYIKQNEMKMWLIKMKEISSTLSDLLACKCNTDSYWKFQQNDKIEREDGEGF